ncbi:MAG: AEC family transporter [Clostridia bacterium]
MTVIYTKIFYLGFMILIGFLCEKTGYVDNICDRTAKLIKNVTLPLLVLTSVTGQTVEKSIAGEAAIIVIFAFATMAFLAIVGLATAKIFKLDDKQTPVHICLGTFGNVVFLCYPLVQALFGDMGIFYAVFYAIANDSMLWTLGVASVSGEKGLKSLKHLVNPCTVIFAVSLVMLCFGIKLPAVINDVFSSVGSATTPLSMMFIGATLSGISFVGALKKPQIYILTIVKMIVAPVLVMLLLRAASSALPLSETARGALIFQVAMPCQTIFAVIASEYKLDTAYAAEIIFITTVFSAISLPLVYGLMGVIF